MASDTNLFTLDLDSVRFIGQDLMRPECVIATHSGMLHVPDWRGGVVSIASDGTQSQIACFERKEDARILPNGIALLRDGTFLVANLGADGGIWRLHLDGHYEPWLTEVDGVSLPAVNFVWLDQQERVWFTVMFRSHPGAGRHNFLSDVADAFVGVVESFKNPKSARIVGEGIFSANECRIGLDGKHIYVNETFAHQLCRFPLAADGTLGSREVFAQFDENTIPDGLTLDAEGGLWITGVAANRIIRVMPNGTWHVVAEDFEESHMEKIRSAVKDGSLNRTLLYDNHARVLPNVTSIAFGGADMKTAYVGSVSGDRIAVFKSPVAGAKPVHWDW